MRMSNETVDTVGYSKYPANVYTFQQMYIHFRVLSCCEVKKFLFKYPENFSIWKKLVVIFPKESRSKWTSIWLNISYMRRNTLNQKSFVFLLILLLDWDCFRLLKKGFTMTKKILLSSAVTDWFVIILAGASNNCVCSEQRVNTGDS